jgi:NAD-dependent deacetylase
MTPHEKIAVWLRQARSAVAFTGAGISTESGIPDFRSPGGIWATSTPVYFDEFLRSAESRYEYWRQKAVAHRDFAGSKPNAGHEILARWEMAGMLQAVITQNIDGLHQDAGSRRVLELHGTARWIACLDCGDRNEAGPLIEQFLSEDTVPQCEKCGGLLKHATVSFGQMLPEDVLEEATTRSAAADLFLAIGSSLVVSPANGLPALARQSGGRLVIINRDATPLDRMADVVLREPIGKTLKIVEDCLKRVA